MKLLGFELKRQQSKDAVLVQNVKPTTIPISKIPAIPPQILNFEQTYTFGRGVFKAGEYDLSEIGKVEDTDSYVRQAFKKKLGLMYKEGTCYSGSNKNTIRYIKTRMAQMARASGIPTEQLMERIGASLIRVSNAFLVKVRDKTASGGRMRRDEDGEALEPVAAYFPAAPETMRFEIDMETGAVSAWKQQLPSGRFKIFPPEDVVHFVINRREGFNYGVPDLVPVIDDIRSLRQIEENIELLIYQYLFPLFHYKVGTESAPAGYTEDGQREIDVVMQQIQYMPSEGALVTPERHEITAIGAEGRALRAENYLNYFKTRVFAGLGVSNVDMGEGNTTTRATALTLSRQLIDSVKTIQTSMEQQWDQFVIQDLLMESTFGEKVLEEDNMVHLKFHEIDLNKKMELGKYNIELFQSNGLTWDEYRSELGREPIPVPDDPETQKVEDWPEWFNTYWKLFEEPAKLISAVDEPYSAAAKAMAESRSTGMTNKQIQKSGEEQMATIKAKKPPTPPKSIKKKDEYQFTDSTLTGLFKDLENDTVMRVRSNVIMRGGINQDWLIATGRTWASAVSDMMKPLLFNELTRGFNNQTGGRAGEGMLLIHRGRQDVEKRMDNYLNRLVRHLVSLINHRVDVNNKDVKLLEVQQEIEQEVRIAFDVVRYRTDFIWDVELRKAYNYGRVLGMRYVGQQGFKCMAADGACENCQAAHGRLVEADYASIDEVPPFHPFSRMTMEVQDSLANAPMRAPGKPAVAQDNPGLQARTGVCPDCGMTVTKQMRSNNYFCNRCNKTYDKEDIEKNTEDDNDDVTDSAALERCITKVKAQQRKKNPGKSDEEISSSAWAICRSSLKE